ncbi:hypothetical protein [Ralstonia phage RP13]|nr:hypothetical protein [Ralstonia phage RP13]
MSMKSLSELRALYKEPQLMHKWSIEVPTWPNAVAPSNPDVLFLITSSSLPEPEYENVQVELGAFKFNYNAKESRNGKVTWTFFDNTDSDIIKYFFIDYANKRQNSASTTSITMESAVSADLIAPIVNCNLLAADGKTVTKRAQMVNVLFQPTNFGGELGQEAAVQKPTIDVLFDSFVWVKV